MSVSDADIELLEAHLDGELSIVAEASLRHRLLSDRDLIRAMDALRADRGTRAGIFESLEPNDATVRHLVSSIRRQLNKDAVHGDRMRILRYIGSAAACVLISFSAGWLGKGRVAAPYPGASQSQTVAQNTTAGSPDFTGDQGVGTLVSNTFGTAGTSRRPNGIQPGYQVALTDSLGRVVAVQHFDTLEEARAFRDDVGRWQKQQQQAGGVDTEPVMYKDQF